MLATKPRDLPQALLVLALCFISSVRTLVITSPLDGDVWNGDGTANVIQWDVLPATWPENPTYFDILMVNGIGELYTPFLNLSIATGLNAFAASSLSFTLAGQLRSGSGYRLYFTDPSDSGNVYTESGVFSIVGSTGTASVLTSTDAASSTSTTSSTSSTTTAFSSSSSSTSSTSSSTTSYTSSDSSTSTPHSTKISTSTHAPTTTREGVVGSDGPGGLADQSSLDDIWSGAPVLGPRWAAAGSILLAGLVGAVLL